MGDDHDTTPTGTFHELRTSGLLWLFNTAVLHPRGFAVGFVYPDDATAYQITAGAVEPIGWQLFGDGTEPWRFDIDDATLDRLFDSVQTLLAVQQDEPDGH